MKRFPRRKYWVFKREKKKSQICVIIILWVFFFFLFFPIYACPSLAVTWQTFQDISEICGLGQTQPLLTNALKQEKWLDKLGSWVKKVVPIFILLAQIMRLKSLNYCFWKCQVRVMAQKEWGETEVVQGERETMRGVVNGGIIS